VAWRWPSTTEGVAIVEATFLAAVVLLLLACDPFGKIPIFIRALRDVPWVSDRAAMNAPALAAKLAA
jgi:small neutral amino acid transporter SnatA (MarC family)